MKGEEKTRFLSAFQEEAGASAPPDRRGVEGVWAAEPLFSGFIADLCRFSVRRYVWVGICGFLTMCWKTDKASLVKGVDRERRLWRMKRPKDPMKQGVHKALAPMHDYAELWKGDSSACEKTEGLGRREHNPSGAPRQLPLTREPFGWAVLKDEGFHDGCVGWLRSAGASPRPTGNGVPSQCCRTGKVPGEKWHCCTGKLLG